MQRSGYESLIVYLFIVFAVSVTFYNAHGRRGERDDMDASTNCDMFNFKWYVEYANR